MRRDLYEGMDRLLKKDVLLSVYPKHWKSDSQKKKYLRLVLQIIYVSLSNFGQSGEEPNVPG